MKKVKEAMKEKGAGEDQVKEFETAAQGYAKKIVANFKDYDFLIGESMDPDGMYEPLNCTTSCSIRADELFSSYQGPAFELSRRWRHAVYHSLEAWLDGNEGVNVDLLR